MGQPFLRVSNCDTGGYGEELAGANVILQYTFLSFVSHSIAMYMPHKLHAPFSQTVISRAEAVALESRITVL